MKIYLPNSAFLGNIETFLRKIDPSDPTTLQITSHKQWIAVHPVVLSMTAALGLSTKPNSITCEPLEAKSKNYFDRMGLFKILNIKSNLTFTEHESAGRFIPISQIRNSSEQTRFITEMVPLLHLPPSQAEPIKYIIAELTRNVFEHSQSKQGAIICAQYYHDSNTIKIGIADTGVGIKHTISSAYPIVKTDLEAITYALIPGITGKTSRLGGTSENVGAGLFFIKSIAKVNRDFFIIYSGSALYKLLKTPVNKQVRLYANPLKDNHSGKDDLPYWQGTAVGVDINLNQKNDFSTLLSAIRRAYIDGMKERRKIRYREPKFI